MRTFKTVAAVLICLALIFQLSAFAYAGSDADDAPGSRYEPVCGNNAYHHMVYRCSGTTAKLSGGSVYISSGYVWQCTNCYLVMVTEGTIVGNQMQTIGKWGTRSYSAPVYSLTSVTVTSYGYCSSNSMSGFQFFTA